jgi:hypothetical protein
MIDIARLGHADDRVYQQVGFNIARRAKSQLLVSTMHRITRLERDDFPPTHFFESTAQLGGCFPEMSEIVMHGRFDAG